MAFDSDTISKLLIDPWGSIQWTMAVAMAFLFLDPTRDVEMQIVMGDGYIILLEEFSFW